MIIHNAHGISGAPHIDKHDMSRLILCKFLPNILENTKRQRCRRTLVHEALHPLHPRHFTPCQKRPALCIRIISGNSHHPLPRKALRRLTMALQCGLFSGDTSHMLDHHSGHGLDGENFFFPRESYGHGNAVGYVARMGVGDAFVCYLFHLFLGAWIVEGEADEAFGVRDGVFVVGRCGGGGCFAHGAGLVEANHIGIETLRVAIENNIDTTPSGGGDNAVMSAKVYSYDGHG
mmetsp:Transcript_37441/g.67390  ORF Transcript_37441/g.67390 Transcript_37441/m.67390 type:complete len:233 (-) Transcript_37441:52-750(-)